MHVWYLCCCQRIADLCLHVYISWKLCSRENNKRQIMRRKRWASFLSPQILVPLLMAMSLLNPERRFVRLARKSLQYYLTLEIPPRINITYFFKISMVSVTLFLSTSDLEEVLMKIKVRLLLMYTNVNLATGHSRALSTTDEGKGFLQEWFESFIIKILIYFWGHTGEKTPASGCNGPTAPSSPQRKAHRHGCAREDDGLCPVKDS